MSAVGTTPLQSPGWNEGKARYETLGIQRTQKIKSSVGAALTEQVLALRCDCAALTGLLYVIQINRHYYFEAHQVGL